MTLKEIKNKVLALIEELNPDIKELTEDPDIAIKLNHIINQVMGENRGPVGRISAVGSANRAYDAYALGDKVTHMEKKWVSTVDGNVWEPGVYGWVEE